jgi:hypothetical protein
VLGINQDKVIARMPTEFDNLGRGKPYETPDDDLTGL